MLLKKANRPIVPPARSWNRSIERLPAGEIGLRGVGNEQLHVDARLGSIAGPPFRKPLQEPLAAQSNVLPRTPAVSRKSESGVSSDNSRNTMDSAGKTVPRRMAKLFQHLTRSMERFSLHGYP
jgi:hypothetical protein